MKIISGFKLCLGAALVGAASAAVPTPLSNVQVTLKGKKYQIDDVTTVSELQERLEEQSGIAPSKQGKILHNGKRLSTNPNSEPSLSEAGVEQGDQLNCVPSKKSSSSKKKVSTTTAAASSAASAVSSSSGASAAAGGMGGMDGLADMMSGMAGAGGLDDMISKMMSGGMPGMGGGGAGGGMPDMAESMTMMKDLLNSPMFAQFMDDPEKIEEARQMILQNPMMKTMMLSMPGMSELLADKDAWAQAMMAAAGIMKSMEPEDMLKMMEAQGGGMGGGGMPPGMGGAGFFDGAGASSSALDELSEGED